jgi:aerobic C4-dicarboxylate transport protein
VVAKWTGDLDMERMHQRLNQETVVEAEEPEVVLDATETRMPVAPMPVTPMSSSNMAAPQMPASR